MAKKQSSIDKFVLQLKRNGLLFFEDSEYIVAYSEAKAMHKEEIEDALEAGYQIANEDVKFKHIHTAEQYYNEAFRETKT